MGLVSTGFGLMFQVSASGQQDIAEVDRMIRSLEGSASAVATKFSMAGQQLTRVGAGLTAVGAAGGLFMASATKEAIRFEGAVNGVTRVMGKLNEGEVKVFEKDLKSLALILPGTASDMAKASTALARSGVGIKDLAAATQEAVAFSVASGMEMGNAANVLVRTFNVFKQEGEKLPDVMGSISSSLIAVANSAPTTADQLANVVRRAGAGAAQLGLTAQETIGLAAALQSVGVTAQIGGTALTKLGVAMASKVEKAAMAAGMTLDQYMGLSARDKLFAVIQNLSALQKVGTPEALAKSGELMKGLVGSGVRSTMAINGLIKSINDSAEGFGGVSNQLEKYIVIADRAAAATGDNSATQTMMRKQAETLSFQMGLLGAAFTNLQTELAAGMMPVLKIITGAFRFLVDLLISLPTPVKTVIGLGIVFGSVLFILAGGLLLAGGMMLMFMGGLMQTAVYMGINIAQVKGLSLWTAVLSKSLGFLVGAQKAHIIGNFLQMVSTQGVVKTLKFYWFWSWKARLATLISTKALIGYGNAALGASKKMLLLAKNIGIVAARGLIIAAVVGPFLWLAKAAWDAGDKMQAIQTGLLGIGLGVIVLGALMGKILFVKIGVLLILFAGVLKAVEVVWGWTESWLASMAAGFVAAAAALAIFGALFDIAILTPVAIGLFIVGGLIALIYAIGEAISYALAGTEFAAWWDKWIKGGEVINWVKEQITFLGGWIKSFSVNGGLYVQEMFAHMGLYLAKFARFFSNVWTDIKFGTLSIFNSMWGKMIEYAGAAMSKIIEWIMPLIKAFDAVSGTNLAAGLEGIESKMVDLQSASLARGEALKMEHAEERASNDAGVAAAEANLKSIQQELHIKEQSQLADLALLKSADMLKDRYDRNFAAGGLVDKATGKLKGGGKSIREAFKTKEDFLKSTMTADERKRLAIMKEEEKAAAKTGEAGVMGTLGDLFGGAEVEGAISPTDLPNLMDTMPGVQPGTDSAAIEKQTKALLDGMKENRPNVKVEVDGREVEAKTSDQRGGLAALGGVNPFAVAAGMGD